MLMPTPSPVTLLGDEPLKEFTIKKVAGGGEGGGFSPNLRLLSRENFPVQQLTAPLANQ
jgi:hypothetical protein